MDTNNILSLSAVQKQFEAAIAIERANHAKLQEIAALTQQILARDELIAAEATLAFRALQLRRLGRMAEAMRVELVSSCAARLAADAAEVAS